MNDLPEVREAVLSDGGDGRWFYCFLSDGKRVSGAECDDLQRRYAEAGVTVPTRRGKPEDWAGSVEVDLDWPDVVNEHYRSLLKLHDPQPGTN